MKRLFAILAMGALLVSGLVSAAPPAAALDAGTFTVSGWSSGNLTIDGLTISRDAGGTYRVQSLVYTVGGTTVSVPGYTDQGCTPNGGECRVITATSINAKDNSQAYWFIASLAGMDGPSPTLTMFDAKVRGSYWDGFGSSASTGLAASLVPAKPTLSGISPNTSRETGGGTADISGAGLSGATAVTIGATPAQIVTSTGDRIVVTVPSVLSNPTGTPVDVTVTTPTGTATLPGAFTYLSNPPSVASVTPSCGVAAGTALTISGFRLTGATAVTIGGQSVAFTVTGSTRIDTTAPALSDIQPVIVTTPAGSSSGLTSVSYRPCAPLPPLTLTTTSTTVAGGFATIQWSFPAGDPNLGNVLGLQYAPNRGGPYTNVGGTRTGTTGSFTVAGLTKSPVLVFVKTVNALPSLGTDSVKPVAVTFASTPTALPPNTGNAGSVPPPATPGTSTGSTTSGGASDPNPGDSAAVDAPCLAPAGRLYPTAYGTVGSQLVVVPGRPGDPVPTEVTVTTGALPPGMGLDSSTGVVFGVPTAAGRYSATVTGRTPAGRVTGPLDITVDNDAQTLTYPALVTGGVGQSMAAGPTTNAPVGSTYELVCGTLPAGTAFDTRTGVISGIPTAQVLVSPPLRIIERNSAGSAAASFVFLVGPAGQARLSYPTSVHLRASKATRIRPSVVAGGDIAFYKVIRGKLNRGLRLEPTTGIITGRPQHRTYLRAHTVTIAGVRADGTLVVANPMQISVRRHR